MPLNPNVAHVAMDGNSSVNVCNAAFYTFINWNLNQVFLNFKHGHAIFKSTSYSSLWAKFHICLESILSYDVNN